MVDGSHSSHYVPEDGSHSGHYTPEYGSHSGHFGPNADGSHSGHMSVVDDSHSGHYSNLDGSHSGHYSLEDGSHFGNMASTAPSTTGSFDYEPKTKKKPTLKRHRMAKLALEVLADEYQQKGVYEDEKQVRIFGGVEL